MGLIKGKKLDQLKKGYPTVSDKYYVAGGTNEDVSAMEFGEVVTYGTQTGYYKKLTSSSTKIAGICMSKNVKLVNFYPGGTAQAQILPGEAIDLFVSGFLAVEVEDNVVACTAAETTDTTVQSDTTYYKIVATGKKPGKLVDASGNEYAVGTPTANPKTEGFYEVSAEGSDTNLAAYAEGVTAYVVKTTGLFTTSSSSTIEYGQFTGVTEIVGGKILAEILVK